MAAGHANASTTPANRSIRAILHPRCSLSTRLGHSALDWQSRSTQTGDHFCAEDSMAETIRLGTAGWVFEAWRKSYYPDGLKQKDELAYSSARLGNIEINATFYSHQKAASFLNWAGQTPDDFVFT